MSDTTGAICPGCEEPILPGQSVIRISAGLLLEQERFDPLVMRPDVYIHAGAGYDTRHDVHDRWCVSPEAVWKAVELLRISGETSPSGH